MRYVVLGCGPSGLLAAQALVNYGEDPEIISHKRKSPIGGAQFLHTSIPEVTSANHDGEVIFLKKGTKEGYARKVYGDPKAPTSWDSYDGLVPVWSLRKAYDRLWELHERNIINTSIHQGSLLLADKTRDKFISSIPAMFLCMNPTHWFKSQKVWITYEQVGAETKGHFIRYSGSDEDFWYRESLLFGWHSIEWPGPVPGAVEVSKPLATNCDCRPHITRVGRYGRWEKGVLAHHAYDETLRLL